MKVRAGSLGGRASPLPPVPGNGPVFHSSPFKMHVDEIQASRGASVTENGHYMAAKIVYGTLA